jgi:hypothetical protein
MFIEMPMSGNLHPSLYDSAECKNIDRLPRDFGQRRTLSRSCNLFQVAALYLSNNSADFQKRAAGALK